MAQVLALGVVTGTLPAVASAVLSAADAHAAAAVAGATWIGRHPAATPSPRTGYSLAYDSVRRVTVLFGGYDGSNVLNDTWEYDGITWTQRNSSTLPTARQNGGMAYSPSEQRVVMFGGSGTTGLLNDTYEWDGSNWTLRCVGVCGPSNRQSAAMVNDSTRQRVVLFGGQGLGLLPNGPLNDTWEWNGSSWTQTVAGTTVSGDPLNGCAYASTNVPPLRSAAAAAFDSTRSRTVLYGGSNGNCSYDDTWEYAGGGWALVRAEGDTATHPGRRSGAAAAYDSTRSLTVLLGGCTASGADARTFEWDGSSWTDRTAALTTSPPARTGHSLAYDSVRERTVTVDGSGSCASAQPLSDTWELSAPPPSSDITTLVSTDLNVAPGVSGSSAPAVSADGSVVAFTSTATNLVDGASNGVANVYVKSRATGAVSLASVAADGSEPSSPSGAAAVSGDGRYVAFTSTSRALVAGDPNPAGRSALYLRDTVGGTTELVSVALAGAALNADVVGAPALSGDGRYVAYLSTASDVVSNDTSGLLEAFIRDRTTGLTSRVSVSSAGVQQSGGVPVGTPSIAISPDGRTTAFIATSPSLVPGKTSTQADVFVHDSVTGSTQRASVSSTGLEANGPSGSSAAPGDSLGFSADGRYLLFTSTATNLAAGGASGALSAYVRDLITSTTTLASVDGSGRQLGAITGAAISGNGRLVAVATGSPQQIQVHDMVLGSTAVGSAADTGSAGDQSSADPALDRGGDLLVFDSLAGNLVPFAYAGRPQVAAHAITLGPIPSVNGLALTATETSIPSGAQVVPLSRIPFSRLPQIVDAPVGAPVGSVPVNGVPVGSVFLSLGPVGSVPVGSVPVGSVPVGSVGVGGIPVGSVFLSLGPVGSIPISQVQLSTIPGVDWTAVLANSPGLNGLPLQTLTLGQVLNDANASAAFNKLTIGQSGFGGTLFRGLTLGAILLAGVPLTSIPVPLGYPDWCSFLVAAGWQLAASSCGSGQTVDPAVDSLVGIDIAGAPMGSVPVGSVPVGSVPVGSVPVGSVPVGSINLSATPVGSVPVGSIPTAKRNSVVTCSNVQVNCADGSAQTLGQVQALTPSGIQPGARLSDLVPPIGNVTIGELIPGLLPIGSLAWEKLALDGLQDVVPTTAQGVHYKVDFDVTCGGGVNPPVSVSLPRGFRYVDGSAAVSIQGSTAVPFADPKGIDAPLADVTQTVVWPAVTPAPCTGLLSGSQHVQVSFRAQPGLDVGLATASATVGGAAVDGQAPILVVDTNGINTAISSAPVIQPDQLVLGHIAAGGDTASFRVPIPAYGSRVTVRLSHVAQGSDFDLTVLQPPVASLISSPVGSVPVGSVPVGDEGRTTHDSGTTLQGESLQDVPVGSVPVGSVPVGSVAIAGVSQTRGSADEQVTVTTGSETGYYTVQVSGYNASTSNRPFLLRVGVTPPAALPSCPARSFPNAPGTAATLPAPGSLAAGTTTLFITDRQRLTAIYGAGAASALMSQLGSFASANHGAVIPVDGDGATRGDLSAWDASPCAPTLANTVVRDINAVVAPYRAAQASLKYIVIVGSDEVVPMARQVDQTTISNEIDYSRDLSFLLSSGTSTQANALYAGELLGNYLTDDPYTSLVSTPWLGHELALPTLSGGRLLETPSEIQGQLTQYTSSGGLLNPRTALVSGYDFLTSGANAQVTALANRLGSSNVDSSLINNSWTRTALLNKLTPSGGAAPDLAAINAHYDHYQLLPAGPSASGVYSTSDLVGTNDLPASSQQTFAGRVLFTVGCHGGFSVPDSLLPAPTGAQATRLEDWAQYYAQNRAAVYVANTGYGYGDTETLALSSRLMTLLAQNFQDDSLPIGDKLVRAKHAYFDSAGAYGPYDEKALEEATLYGLPMYRINGTSTPPAQAPQGVVSTDPNGVRIVSFSPSPVRSDTARGTFWSGPNGQTEVIQYRAIQPLYQQEVTLAGTTVHGLWVRSLGTTDVNGVTPALGYPTIDSSAAEPPPGFVDETFPTSFLHMSRSIALGSDRQFAVLIAGQYRGQGVERLVTSLVAETTTSTSTQNRAPLIEQLQPTRLADGSIVIFLRATTVDPGGISRAGAMYLDGAGWHQVALTHGRGDVYQATVRPQGSTDIDVFGEVQDASGNVAYSTDKGGLFHSVSAASVPAPTIEVLSPQQGAFYGTGKPLTAQYVCSSPAGIETCTGTVANGAAVDTSKPGTFTFSVTATDAAGHSTTVQRTYTVGTAADLSAALAANPNPATLHQSLVYVGTAANAGPSDATGVSLGLTLPTTVSIQNVTPSQGTCITSGQAVSCALGTVVSAGSATVTVTVLPLRSGTLMATAVVSANEHDPNTANNTASAAVTVAAPVNGPIGFMSVRSGDESLWTMTPGGASQTRNTAIGPDSDDMPAWSPDGSRLAYRCDIDPNEHYDICTINADGSGLKQLTTDVLDGNPTWSPDGTRIAYDVTVSSTVTVWVMKADGTGKTQVTTAAQKSSQPRWSPDGAHISVLSTRDGQAEYYVMNPDGSGQARITTGGKVVGPAEWSPDGTRFVFASTRDVSNSQIYVMNVDGTGVRRLASNTATEQLPAWSPDGMLVAFTSDRGQSGNPDIWTMSSADGSAATRLTTAGGFDGEITWRAQ